MKFDKSKIKKILVIKHGAIGDVILSTPVVENLRAEFPDANIVFLTQKYCREALTGNPFINRILTYDLSIDGGWFIIKNIRKQKYDLVIDLFGNPRTALITLFSGAKYKVGFRFNWRTVAYNIKIKPRSAEVHNIDFNLDSLRALELTTEKRNPYFCYNAVHKEFADNFFKENFPDNRKVIGINPCGSWPTKVWDIDKFEELAKRFDKEYNILIFWGGINEKAVAEKLKKKLDVNAAIIPDIDIKYLGALASKCEVFITNDTGPMHIAWALGVRTAAIFGPTNSHLQGPLSANSIIIKNESLSCLGCNLTKLEECHYEHKCMKELSVVNVYEKILKLINK